MAADPANGFANSFAAFADDFGSWLADPFGAGNFVAFSDDAAASAVTAPQAPAAFADGVVNVTGEAVQGVQGLFANAARSSWSTVAPYVLVGGLVWLVIEVRKAR
jgi:hypothetical protein